MNLAITNRDEEILASLSLKVHVASLEQIGAAWWCGSAEPTRAARERLRMLEQGDWVLRRRVNTHPLLPLREPVLRWSPGQSDPPFGAVSYQLKKRWTKPLELTTVYVASRKTAQLFGGFGGKFKHRTQLTHDVHMAAIYFAKLAADPSIQDRWSGEEERATPGEKLPDAVLMDSTGLAQEAIEFGGKYDTRRVEAFHRYCEVRRLRYELW